MFLIRFVRSAGWRLLARIAPEQKARLIILTLLSTLTGLISSVQVVIFIGLLEFITGSTKSTIPYLGQIIGYLQQWVSFVRELQPGDLLYVYISIYAGVFFVSQALELLMRAETVRLTTFYTWRLRDIALKHFFHLRMDFITSRKFGEIGSLVFGPIHSVSFVLSGTVRAASILLKSFFLLMALVYISPLLSIYVLVLGVAAVFALRQVQRILTPYSVRVRLLQITSSGMMSDILLGLRLIRQTGREELFGKRYTEVAADADRQSIGFEDRKNVLNFFIYAGGAAIIIVFAVLISRVHGIALSSQIGFSLGYLLTVWRLTNEIKSGIEYMMEVNPHLPHITSLGEMLEDQSILDEPRMSLAGNHVSFSGGIKVSDLRFSYSPEKEVLSGIDLSLRPGQLAGIFGLSGSGKSTLLDILAGFRSGYTGQVSIGGRPLKEVNASEYRRKVGYANQNAIVFHGSVAENIGFFDTSISLEDIRKAAEQSCADDFISAMSHQYESQIDEGGIRLSGGQRQRIVLARTLLSQPEFLLLDEAMSAIDAPTEAKIVQNLKAMRSNRIILMATHNLSIAPMLDFIFYMHDGRIVESGTYDQLVKMNGQFNALRKLRTGVVDVQHPVVLSSAASGL
jgi:ABC-type bacteriocin/lantibiotic exporter with double-glycine peptidase domain